MDVTDPPKPNKDGLTDCNDVRFKRCVDVIKIMDGLGTRDVYHRESKQPRMAHISVSIRRAY